MNAQYSLISFQKGKEKSQILISDSGMRGVSADTVSTQEAGAGGGGKLQRVRGLFAVTAAEQCRSMPLFTTSARPGACQPVLHLPVSPYAQLSWRRNRDGSSSWCRSKSQKTDTEPSYVNIVRKTVTLFPMVIELHTVMLFREHLANVLLHFEKQLCKYSWNRLMGSVFCILENWSYR